MVTRQPDISSMRLRGAFGHGETNPGARYPGGGIGTAKIAIEDAFVIGGLDYRSNIVNGENDFSRAL